MRPLLTRPSGTQGHRKGDRVMSSNLDTCARCERPVQVEVWCEYHFDEYQSEWACHGPRGCGDIHEGEYEVCPRSGVGRNAGAGSEV